MSHKTRSRKKRLMRLFPRLKAGNFRITSRRTPQYNCVAWAAGNNERWRDPILKLYWPPGVPRHGTSLDAIVAVYESLGFTVCPEQNRTREAGFDKVAIYGTHKGYTYAARQLEDGRWASKLGELEDIEHDSLDDLTESDYGEVVKILKKLHESS